MKNYESTILITSCQHNCHIFPHIYYLDCNDFHTSTHRKNSIVYLENIKREIQYLSTIKYHYSRSSSNFLFLNILIIKKQMVGCLFKLQYIYIL